MLKISLSPLSLFTTTFIILSVLCQGCKESSAEKANIDVSEPIVKRDLPQIKKDGKLKALTVYSGTSYFLYRGKPMGYEYELLERLAEFLELELEIVVAKDINELISMLNRGDGDLLAHGLTITSDRKAAVAFSNYLYLTKQVLVQKNQIIGELCIGIS